MYGEWKPYVPVAERRKQAAKKMQKLKKQGLDVQPVEIQGNKIATSFWGLAWNQHLESFSTLVNRITRGKTYARNGSVCHLEINKGTVQAYVSGSELYKVNVQIAPLPKSKWNNLKSKCTGQVGSMLDLLQGKISSNIMTIVTEQKSGLFPDPKEINFHCDCPDGAYMCKHIAAVLYGIGARLDNSPELLFKLRAVDHQELIITDVSKLDPTNSTKTKKRRIANSSVANVFGIDIPEETPQATKNVVKKTTKKATKKTAKNRIKTTKKAAKKATQKKAKLNLAAKVKPIFTSNDIIKLRKKFDMKEIEFAYICGVSKLTVQNWENSFGQLKLRSNSQKSLEIVSTMSIKKARKELSDITGF